MFLVRFAIKSAFCGFTVRFGSAFYEFALRFAVLQYIKGFVVHFAIYSAFCSFAVRFCDLQCV